MASERVLEALSRKPFAVVGHRCAAGEAVENTLGALRRALGAGVDLVEVDVQVTADGVPVVLHDDSLLRVAGVDLNVRRASWSEVSRVELPGGERVPLLEELLAEASGRVPVLVEVKHPEDTEAVVKILREYLEWVAIISFHDAALEMASRLVPGIATGLIYARPPGRVVDAKRLGCRIVLPRYALATEKAVALAHKLKLKVVAWTVNDEPTALRLVRLGVDAVATDYPSKMVKLRERLA